MNKLMERLDSLRTLIQTPEFLEGKGLSNEVNIRIFAMTRGWKWQCGTSPRSW